ncbi:MAG: acetyl-CoA carboxylase biotin carboxylase subunit, partial [Burkholderiales bacterium]|nr:acetyl-CoA carboxylase biotin carboxylase subunit [Burkholderiales bacterium]
IRVDAGIRAGDAITPHYDSMIAKLIVLAEDRDDAIARMKRALGELRLEGVKSTRALHLALLDDPSFRAARFDTNFLEPWLAARTPAKPSAVPTTSA